MEGSADNAEISPENPKLVKLTDENEANRCIFCRKSQLNELEWGVMYQLDDIVVHYFCLLFCAALNQRGQDHEGILGFLPADIKKEVRRGEKLKCKYCKMKGATLGCAVAKCKWSFHFTCGIPNGTLHQFSGSFDSYCCTHKPKVEIPVPKEMWTCGICLTEVEESENPVWPPCCKNIIYHRLCMQHYASTSGSYFFSCPHCKNNDTFVEAMKKSGVYVPDRDAQWELEPGAFSELAQTYSRCDAKNCFCHRGREYEKSSSRRWRMLKCDLCGSAAIHAFCGELSDETTTWKCPGCTRIVSQGRHSNFSREPQRQRSSDDLSDIDVISSSSEKCIMQLAARSSLVGIERELNLHHHPREYIMKPGHIQVEKEYRDREPSSFSQIKAKLQEKFSQFALDASKHAKSISSEKEVAFAKSASDAQASLRQKLTNLKKNVTASSDISERDYSVGISSGKNDLRSLSVSNLDLSEHRSKKLTKKVDLPAFLESSRFESLKTFKIPKKVQPDPSKEKIRKKSICESDSESRSPATKTKHSSDKKLKKVPKFGEGSVSNIPPRLREDIRCFFKKIKHPSSTVDSLPEVLPQDNPLVVDVSKRFQDSENVSRCTHSINALDKTSGGGRMKPDLDDYDDDIEIISVKTKSSKSEQLLEIIDIADESPDYSFQSEPAGSRDMEDSDEVIVLDDSEKSEDSSNKCIQTSRKNYLDDTGTPPQKRIRMRDDI